MTPPTETNALVAPGFGFAIPQPVADLVDEVRAYVAEDVLPAVVGAGQ